MLVVSFVNVLFLGLKRGVLLLLVFLKIDKLDVDS